MSLRFPGRDEMAGEFVKYDPHTREVFVTELCTAEGMKLSTRPSSSLSGSVCSFEEVQEVSAIPSSNTFAQVPARQFWFVTEHYTDNTEEAHRVIRLPAAEFSLPLLPPSIPVFNLADTLSKVEVEELEVEEPEVKEPSAKRARSCSTTNPIASAF